MKHNYYAANLFFTTILFLAFSTLFAEEEHKIPEAIASHPNWKIIKDSEYCGPSTSHRIIGGKNAFLGQYPWMARLGYMDEEGLLTYECAGSMISERYILTAAHCGTEAMESKGKRLSEVVMGEHVVDQEKDCEFGLCAEPLQVFQVEDEICHPEYDMGEFTNDICLLRLANSIVENDYVSRICMPAYDFMLNSTFEGTDAFVAGWGIMTLDTKESAKVLQTLSVPIVPFKTCEISYTYQYVLTDKQMCAGGVVGKDSCGGDSGGPLMEAFAVNTHARYFLLGITSYGAGECAQSNLPAVYTVVSKYWKWILDNLKP